MNLEAKIMSRKYLRLLYYLLPLVSVVSFIFPFAVKWMTNKLLCSFKNYYGHARSVRISMFPVSCTIREFHFDKVNPLTQDQPLFFYADRLEIKFERAALRESMLICDIVAQGPDFTFVKNTPKMERIAQIRSAFDIGFPVVVKTFEVKQGLLEYIDQSREKTVELKATGIQASGTNLTNIQFDGLSTFTDVTMTANVYEGVLSANLKADLLSPQPSFEAQMEVKNVNMVLLNSFFEAYGKFDVNGGTLGLFTEVAASEGNFKGYVKPFIRDLEIFKADEKKGFFKSLWQGFMGAMMGGVAEVFENRGGLATKIEFKGSFSKVNINVWYAVMEALRNAFVRGLKPSFDFGINMKTVNKPA
jgi:hypothetical protein